MSSLPGRAVPEERRCHRTHPLNLLDRSLRLALGVSRFELQCCRCLVLLSSSLSSACLVSSRLHLDGVVPGLRRNHKKEKLTRAPTTARFGV